jgi:hypothetical protein
MDSKEGPLDLIEQIALLLVTHLPYGSRFVVILCRRELFH